MRIEVLLDVGYIGVETFKILCSKTYIGRTHETNHLKTIRASDFKGYVRFEARTPDQTQRTGVYSGSRCKKTAPSCSNAPPPCTTHRSAVITNGGKKSFHMPMA